MSFENLKATQATADLKAEEPEMVTRDGSGQTSSEPIEETAETDSLPETKEVIDWQARAEQAEAERDNYKQGLLSEKSKKRNLEPEKKEVEEKEVEYEIDENKIRSVIYKDNEKKALKEVINSKSNLFIPELVDDAHYNEIVQYLPHSIDKSSVDSIHRALKLAVHTWKYDKGMNEEKPKSNVKADLASVKGTAGSKVPENKPTGGRKIIKTSSGMEGWY